MTALATGCSERLSAVAARVRSVLSSVPSAGTRSVTTGTPVVTVPVLSSTTTFALRAVSRASPPLMRIPCCAPLPVPTMTATGVARPSAQGQAIISTEISTVNASRKSPVPMSQAVPASRASAMTTGTKMPDILSASLAIGAFDPWASSISFTILAKVVSLPTRVAR